MFRHRINNYYYTQCIIIIHHNFCYDSYSPAAKCNGVLFLPNRSLAFTLSGVDTSALTCSRSPFLQASNKDGPRSHPRLAPKGDRMGEETGEAKGDEIDDEVLIDHSTVVGLICI